MSIAKQSQSTIKMEKGYYLNSFPDKLQTLMESQSTIKMEKGYYRLREIRLTKELKLSQSTIKMEKGYYNLGGAIKIYTLFVAIHNKNGKGLLQLFLGSKTFNFK